MASKKQLKRQIKVLQTALNEAHDALDHLDAVIAEQRERLEFSEANTKEHLADLAEARRLQAEDAERRLQEATSSPEIKADIEGAFKRGQSHGRQVLTQEVVQRLRLLSVSCRVSKGPQARRQPEFPPGLSFRRTPLCASSAWSGIVEFLVFRRDIPDVAPDKRSKRPP